MRHLPIEVFKYQPTVELKSAAAESLRDSHGEFTVKIEKNHLTEVICFWQTPLLTISYRLLPKLNLKGDYFDRN